MYSVYIIFDYKSFNLTISVQMHFKYASFFPRTILAQKLSFLLCTPCGQPRTQGF